LKKGYAFEKIFESTTKLQQQEVFSDHIKGPPKRFTNYYVEGAPSFATLIETTNLPQEEKIYLEPIINPQWKATMEGVRVCYGG
jgi:hypothetical protein